MAWYWENLGGPPGGCTSGPTAVLQPGGLLALFVRGADNAIWRRREWRYENNLFWSSWASLPGGFVTTSSPDAAVNAHGLLVVFARGGDNAIWHTWQPNAYNPDQWAQWQSLGGEFLSGPGAVLQTGGRLVVFARGPMAPSGTVGRLVAMENGRAGSHSGGISSAIQTPPSTLTVDSSSSLAARTKPSGIPGRAPPMANGQAGTRWRVRLSPAPAPCWTPRDG